MFTTDNLLTKINFACLMSAACWWFIESSNLLLLSLQLPSQFLSQICLSRSSSLGPSYTLLPWTVPEMAGLCLTLAAGWLPGSALALTRLEIRAPSRACCLAGALPVRPFLTRALLPWHPARLPALQEASSWLVLCPGCQLGLP